MKVFFILISFILSLSIPLDAISSVNDSFHIKGTFIGKYEGYIYLKYANKLGKSVKDGCLIKDGKFTLKGQVNCYTSLAFLRLSSQSSAEDDPNETRIDLDNSAINVTVSYNDFQHIKVAGVRTSGILRKYNHTKQAVLKKIAYYEQELDSSINAVKKAQINKRLAYYKQLELNKDLTYCKKNPNSNISPLLIINHLRSLSIAELTSTYYSLSSLQQQSYFGNNVYSVLTDRKWKIDQLGLKAPVFVATDINERSIKLDSIYKNKYVLLDFWASWCNPCRASNPFLKTLYNKYATKGFEIIDVADDIGKEAQWRKAIEQDSTTAWINILRTANRKEVKNNKYDIQKMYHVQYLPTRILIDKKGIIIGRYINEEEIEKKLNTIFK